VSEFVDSQAVREYLLGLQERIVLRLETLAGHPFKYDAWEKPADATLGGGGLTRIIEGSALLERGGVGFSHVTGKQLPPSASAQRPELTGRGFEAIGVSLVLHPRNPHVPTVHMNVRFFIARHQDDRPENAPVWWFGGGMDLTPYYAQEEDARHFHASCKGALAPFGAAYHPRFKKWCDEYFFLRHRSEARGIGGVFFDDFNQAAQLAERYVQVYSNDWHGWRIIGAANFALTNLDKALSAFTNAVHLGDNQSCVQLGLCAWKLERLDVMTEILPCVFAAKDNAKSEKDKTDAVGTLVIYASNAGREDVFVKALTDVHPSEIAAREDLTDIVLIACDRFKTKELLPFCEKVRALSKNSTERKQ